VSALSVCGSDWIINFYKEWKLRSPERITEGTASGRLTNTRECSTLMHVTGRFWGQTAYDSCLERTVRD
jgi:hypothetical protein